MKRFVLSLMILLSFSLTADAQIFKRGTQYYNCQNGRCQPIALPALPPESVPDLPLGTKGIGEDFPTGVIPEGLQEGYLINGVKSTKGEVYSTLESTLPELSKKWRLVVVGTTEQRKEVLAKIGTKESVVVNVFPPEHFYVKDMKPNTLLTLMRPDGEVVADGGLADIDKVMDFTKVGPFDPQPKPAPDPVKPDPSKPAPDNTPAPVPAVPWYANICHYIALGIGIVLTFLVRYGFPLVRGFISSKIGTDNEALVEALVNAKLAQFLNRGTVPTVDSVATGWK